MRPTSRTSWPSISTRCARPRSRRRAGRRHSSPDYATMRGMSQRFRLLTEADVRSLLPLNDLIAAMELALARFSTGEVLQPVRSVLLVGPEKGYFGVMPAYVTDPPQLGAKLVTVFGGNLDKGLPSHLAT